MSPRSGTRLIFTANEENNPMFQLNLRLGFEPQPAEIDWEKVIVPPNSLGGEENN